jgi:hypothetical protein
MACSIRARGADYPTIAATLSAINANRCSPQLEHTEIDGIVKSACRYAPGTAAPHVNREVHAELDTFALAVYGAEWRGKASKTDRDVLLALIGYAPRPDRLRQDCVPRLAAGGIVDFDATTDTVRLSDGWQQNLEIERGLKGEIK